MTSLTGTKVATVNQLARESGFFMATSENPNIHFLSLGLGQNEDNYFVSFSPLFTEYIAKKSRNIKPITRTRESL
jgi:hypothetical protein